MSKAISIIIADDEEFISEAYAEGFTRAGYKVHLASNGEEVLELLKTVKPKAILLDLIMPKKGGFETLKAIKANPKNENIVVVVLSNLSKSADVEECLQAGAADYIVKAEHALKDVVAKVNKLLKV